MVATMTPATQDKTAKFKGQDDVRNDLFPPYVGRVIDWDFPDREEKKFGTDEKIVVTYFQLTIDSLDTAIKSTDGLARPSWKMSITPQGNVRPGSTYETVLNSLAAAMQAATGNKDWKIKTSANLDEIVGQVFLFGQVDPTKDERFKKVKADMREKMKPVVLCLGAPPADWEDHVPADLDAQKIAKMAEAVKAQEERKQNEQASVGEAIQATQVAAETESAPTYSFDEHETQYLVAWLDGKKIASIGMSAYQDKELKATVDAAVFQGLQKKTVQAYLAEAGLIVEGKDGLYHAATTD